MATQLHHTPTARSVDRRPETVDVRVTFALAWILGGLFLDGWWHINDPSMETFFTPWHAVLYSGVLVLAGVVAEATLVRRRRGSSWREAVPPGYLPAAAGAALFAAGASTDLVWHEILGIEVGVEALLSPPHLALGAAGLLVMAAPWRAAALSGRRDAPWTAVLSAAFVVAQLGFFTQYAAVQTHLYPAAVPDSTRSVDLLHALGVAAVLLQSGVLAALLLGVVRRFALPPGAVALIVLASSAFMAAERGTWAVVLPAAALAAVVGEVAVRAGGGRATAIAVPLALQAGIVALLAMRGELAWSLELAGGSVLLAGAVGALLASVPAGLPRETAIAP